MYKELFYKELDKIKYPVKNGFTTNLNGKQIGSTSLDKKIGLFNYHIRKGAEAFCPWRFATEDQARIDFGIFGVQNKLSIGLGRKTYEMIPLPVVHPFIPNIHLIVGTDLERFHYIFDSRAESFYKAAYESYVRLGLFKK